MFEKDSELKISILKTFTLRKNMKVMWCVERNFANT